MGAKALETQYRSPFGRHNVGAELGWSTRWLLVAALLLPTVACTIGPDFTAPVAPLAEKFRGTENRSVKSSPLEYVHWWESFRDPTLNKLIQIAYNQT